MSRNARRKEGIKKAVKGFSAKKKKGSQKKEEGKRGEEGKFKRKMAERVFGIWEKQRESKESLHE